MKLKTWFVAMLVLYVSASIYAQQNLARDANVEDLLKKAAEARELVAYRVSQSLELYNGPAENTLSTVSEYLRPRRKRSVTVQRNSNGVVRTEVIWIEKVKYKKINDRDWSVVDTAIPSGDTGGGAATVQELSNKPKPNAKRKFKYLGPEKLGEVQTETYQSTKRSEVAGAFGLETIATSRYWFDPRGRLLKQTEEMRFGIGKKMYSSTTIYEYDVTLNIEAPIP